MPHQLNPGPQQQRAEQHEGECEQGDRRCANCNKDGAHHEREDHSHEEHALMQVCWRPELREDDDEDKQVVHTEGFFDQVGGEVLSPEVRPSPIPHNHTEGDRHRNVETAPQQALAEHHFMRLAGHREEVDQDQQNDGADRDGPHEQRRVHVRDSSSVRGWGWLARA